MSNQAKKLPSKAELEDQARRLLQEARSQSGASVDEMVRLLGAFQSRGAGTRRSWYDWQEHPEAISLMTGLVAMHTLGRDLTLEILFSDSPESRSEVEQLKGEVASLGRKATHLTQEVDHMPEIQKEIDRIGALLGQIVHRLEEAKLWTDRDRQNASTI